MDNKIWKIISSERKGDIRIIIKIIIKMGKKKKEAITV
jgi:hypothetical protein